MFIGISFIYLLQSYEYQHSLLPDAVRVQMTYLTMKTYI